MVNLYKLLNALEQGMTIFQLNRWKSEGIWYPISQYKRETNEIEVVTNLFVPEANKFHIQLSANYDTEEETAAWNTFLEENQWKLYPLLRNIFDVFLLPYHEPGYQFFYTQYPEGFISVIAKPLKPIQS